MYFLEMFSYHFFTIKFLSISVNDVNLLCFVFQELLVILFPLIVVIPSARKIRIMTAGAAVTVLWRIKEPGGTLAVINPT